MTKQTGGPAFPDSEGQADYTGGMSLRDYIAAKAMAALMPVYWDTLDEYRSAAELMRCQVEAAYEYADAMLAERAK